MLMRVRVSLGLWLRIPDYRRAHRMYRMRGRLMDGLHMLLLRSYTLRGRNLSCRRRLSYAVLWLLRLLRRMESRALHRCRMIRCMCYRVVLHGGGLIAWHLGRRGTGCTRSGFSTARRVT
jgi:hypothetical protein